MTELQFAAYCGDLEAVQSQLAEGADVNAQDAGGFTALHWVVEMGCTPGNREEIVRALVDAGADVARQDVIGRTPLQTARDSTSDYLVELLLEIGAT